MTGFSQPERRGLERMQRLRTEQTHPDPDVLAAFSERALTAREHEQVLTHLAVCEACREVVSLAAPTIPEAFAPQSATDPKVWKWAILRWGAVATSAVIVVVAVSVGYLEKEKKAPALTRITSDASPISVPATTEEEVQRDEIPQQVPASAGLKAPQVRYEKIIPKTKKDEAIASLNANLRADNSKVYVFKKELETPNGHGAVGGMLAAKSVPVASTDSPMANKVEPALAGGNTVKSMADDLNSSAAPAEAMRVEPPESPRMGVDGSRVPSASETVEVTAQGQAINTESARIQAANSAPKAKSQKESSAAGRNAAPLYALGREKQYNNLDLKWQVTPEGLLQNSTDQGQNWNNQLTDQRFTHVQTVGSHVWACGPDGVLMHSTDGGTNWTRVTPADKEGKLQGEIKSIVFSDVNHGTLKTSSGETWTTEDAGQSWKKNSGQ